MGKILVTGGAGFIGSNLVDAMIEKGHSVAIVDDLSTGQEANINPKADFHKVDISDYDSLAKALETVKPEAIFHMAAQINVRKSVENPVRDVEVNIKGTVNLLDLAARHNVGHFIFSSTGGAIYGDKAQRPTPEKEESNPQTPYGINKLASEKYIQFFSREHGIKYTILRYANVYGPRQNPLAGAGVVSIFAYKMLKQEPMTMFGDGSQTRDYVFVRDVVKANISALEKGTNGIFNIGTGQETSLNDIVSALEKVTGTKADIKHLPANPSEQLNSCLDISKAQSELDLNEITNLEDGIKELIAFLEERYS